MVVALVAIQAFFLKVYVVPSSSMWPTLQSENAPWQDRILVNRIAYAASPAISGEIVVFHKPTSWVSTEPNTNPFILWVRSISEFVGLGPGLGDVLVKRVAAGPGDRVSCCGASGSILVNGHSSKLSYLGSGLLCGGKPGQPECFEPFVVPKDRYLMLGDNRKNSSDSLAPCLVSGSDLANCARFVPRNNIIGKVAAIVFPLNRLSWLD